MIESLTFSPTHLIESDNIIPIRRGDGGGIDQTGNVVIMIKILLRISKDIAQALESSAERPHVGLNFFFMSIWARCRFSKLFVIL